MFAQAHHHLSLTSSSAMRLDFLEFCDKFRCCCLSRGQLCPLLNVLARCMSFPGRYSMVRLYHWSFVNMRCNHLGVLCNGFLTMIFNSLWSVRTLTFPHAKRHWLKCSQAKTIASSSFSSCAYLVSTDDKVLDMNATSCPPCIRTVPNPCCEASHCSVTSSLTLKCNTGEFLTALLMFAKASCCGSSNHYNILLCISSLSGFVMLAINGRNLLRCWIIPRTHCTTALLSGGAISKISLTFPVSAHRSSSVATCPMNSTLLCCKYSSSGFRTRFHSAHRD